jgi:prephenate dehydrogenase
MRGAAAESTIAIVGVGLIGGSIGLAVQARGLARRVLGVGRTADRLKLAQEAGAITEGTRDAATAVADAHLVLVCTPAASVARQVEQIAPHCPPGCIVTDVASTKAKIVADVAGRLPSGVHFVPAHPLAGSHRTGVGEARADLFEGCQVIVTPSDETDPLALDTVVRFWQALGASVRQMSADAHDAALAVTSHLPHTVAAGLAKVTPAELLPLVASGWRDTTRIAAGDVELWGDVVCENRGHLLRALDRLRRALDEFRDAVERGDRGRITRFLAEGKTTRDAVGG